MAGMFEVTSGRTRLQRKEGVLSQICVTYVVSRYRTSILQCNNSGYCSISVEARKSPVQYINQIKIELNYNAAYVPDDY